MTNRPFSPRQSSNVQILPSVPGREKSMAGKPKSHTGVSKAINSHVSCCFSRFQVEKLPM
eukprot:CAMPEP_0184409576 /NCGR_PEP_ID=MMETSP0738-20130409/4204_1 /TAXON_ID=385413 /ORGANISM="Thalassiosira miniscula, Strain CCMP1093" /LENGTH=59 /DNA_ID=CAMNT_0026767335 /DNA_START=57 /DNA_END=233 /DNA_ORIENTATION=+